MNKNYKPEPLVKKWRTVFVAVVFAMLPALIFAQGKNDFRGVVVDQNSQSLPGVNIIQKGTSNGTVSGADGSFILSADADAIVVNASMVGYITSEFTLKAGQSTNIVLEEDVVSLSEFVIVGYGTQRRSDITGAISKLDGGTIDQIPTGQVATAIQGQVPGINVTPTSGSPGAAINITVRGTGTNGNSQPLYIVDGMRTGDISYLEPGDIESIELLKDAASAAIYGAEAANGVLLITTKLDSKGKSAINYTFQGGFQSPVGTLQPMNSASYAEYINTADVGVTIPTDNQYSTNWLDEIADNAFSQRHNLSFSGGNNKSQYFISGSYADQNGIIGGDKSNYERVTMRFNSKHKLKKWLEVGNNFAFSHTERSALTENDEFNGSITSALGFDPTVPVVYDGTLPEHAQAGLDGGFSLVQNADGQYYGVSNLVFGEVVNPLASIETLKGSTKQDKVLGSVYGKIYFTDDLTLTSRGGIDIANQLYHTWTPTYWFSSERMNTATNTRDNIDMWNTALWENFINYDKTFGKHSVSGLLGVSAQQSKHKYVNTLSGPLFAEGDEFAQHGVTDIDGTVSGNLETKRLLSGFARASYAYDNKYLIDLVVRRDGSSLLAAEQRWGTFPSASAGWVISHEDFFNVDAIDFLKLRASWGRNGSLSNLGFDQFRALITTSGLQYPRPGGGFYTGAEPELLANPELTWETSEQTDIGIDLRMFEGRMSFAADYFVKVTRDLLTPGSPPLSVGNYAPFVNAGDVTNKGFEFELGFRKMEGEFNYNLNFNLATLNNEVTYLNPLLERVSGQEVGTGWTATYFEEGQPVWYFRGYETDGIFQNQAEIDAYIADNGITGYAPAPGDPIIVNTNGDDLINEDDMTYIGDPHPDVMLGANFNANYKGFDLNVFVQGTFGNDILMGFNRTDRATANRPQFFYDNMWTGDGSTNDWFAPTTTDPFAYYSDMMVFDGSYVKIRQIQLGYTIPSSISNKININNLRVYASMENYFTFTSYPGLDPVIGNGDANSMGIDFGYYPTPKMILFGLSLGL